MPVLGAPAETTCCCADTTVTNITDFPFAVESNGLGTDNHIVRWDGTTQIQDSVVTLEDAGEIYGYRAKIETHVASTYTLSADDSGKILEFSDLSGVVVTLSATVPAGCAGTIIQVDTGQVTFEVGAGATMLSFQGLTGTAGRGAAVTWWVASNSDGGSAAFRIAGTMA